MDPMTLLHYNYFVSMLPNGWGRRIPFSEGCGDDRMTPVGTNMTEECILSN